MDLSHNPQLEKLYAYIGPLKSLDISHNTKLKELECYWSDLKELDISHNTELEKLDCNLCALTSLDVTHNPALKSLLCYYNEIKTLDVSNNPLLETLDCSECSLTDLDLHNNINLVSLKCSSNPLTELNLKSNTALSTLYCNYMTSLTSLDLTDNVALTELVCNHNEFTFLNLDNNIALTKLYCAYNNNLASLSLSNNTVLSELNCEYSKSLTSLDLRNNTALTYLGCEGCNFTALDLENNIALEILNCSLNQLTSLDLHNNPALRIPHCTLNKYPITVTTDKRTFDLSMLPGNFDISKASNWEGGNVNGTILTVDKDADQVTYTYDCGQNNSVTFTLKVETIAPADHKILSGADSKWSSNSKEGLVIRGDGELAHFTGVKVDGNLVDAKNYTTKEGSTIVTLKPGYLSTLSTGKHTIELLWIDGSASTSFTVSKSNDNSGNNSGNNNGNNNGGSGNNGSSNSNGNSNSDANANNTKGFVIRLYENVLGRTPDTNGLNAWVSVLQRGSNGGEEVAKGFIFSNEYINKHTSDDAFVEMLYNTLLNRKSDANGRKAWVNQLTSGKETREGIVEGFIHSDEFNKICDAYGIYPTAAEAFASRLYTKCLGRDYDKAGLKAWGNLLHTRQIGGGEAAKGFFFSPEFVNKNLSDTEFVTRCYRTFLGREADTNGLNSWVQLLQTGSSREDILEGFIGSDEYGKLCISYGINR